MMTAMEGFALPAGFGGGGGGSRLIYLVPWNRGLKSICAKAYDEILTKFYLNITSKLFILGIPNFLCGFINVILKCH